MREYRAEQQKVKVVSKVICNCCGKEIGKDIEGVDHVHLEKLWGYYSNKDGRMDDLDICEECYDQWIVTFKYQPKS